MPSPLPSDIRVNAGAGAAGSTDERLAELEELLETQRKSTTDAMNELRESETEKRNLQKKFEQLRSSTSGQMSFMRKKLEEKYQAELDAVEAELDESKDEASALRLQIQQLAEHIQATTGQVR